MSGNKHYRFHFGISKILVAYSFLSIIGGSRNIDRSNIEVISQILKVANGGNATKTRIRYKALLGHNQLKEHLVLLTETDLLRYDGNTATFNTTEKGLQFLKIYDEIEDMIK